MPGFMPGIHDLLALSKAWMAGTSPAMTARKMAPLFQSSGDLIADRRFEWARESLAQGDCAAAIDLLTQALELVPGYAAGWFLLGEAREKAGDIAGAVEALEKAKAADPQDRHGAAMHLIRLGAQERSAMPKGYVRALFDGYAARFDTALTEKLNYTAPEILLRAVRAHHPGRFAAMLDLGCGTGLGGAAFQPHVDAMVGVDLSPGMVAQARAKKIYERLAEADLISFLRDEAKSAKHYPLILAADVFAYLDDLAPVTQAVLPVLEPGGLYAFTVETHDGDGVILRDTLRYAHGEAHVRAALAGFDIHVLEPAVTRTEKSAPVPGLVCVARQPK
jgi:predicted TPR repeat methyltransferase